MKNSDTLRELYIKQGYIPSTCTLDGMIIYGMIQKGECPCDGCNADRNICKGKRKSYSNYDEVDKLMFLIDVCNKTEKRKRYETKLRYKQMIQQRKERHKNNFIVNILEIRWEVSARELPYLEIIAKDVIDEKGYYLKCNDITEMLNYLPYICSKYNIQQIHIEENGYGMALYDEVKKLDIHNVDIVPLRYTRMRLS